MTNQNSFDNIRAWLGEIKQYAEEDVVIMLLGNKVDKPNRVITKEQGEKLAKVISKNKFLVIGFIKIFNKNKKAI